MESHVWASAETRSSPGALSDSSCWATLAAVPNTLYFSARLPTTPVVHSPVCMPSCT